MPSTAIPAACVVAFIGLALPASASEPPLRLAQTTPIKPADVMGDKNRSGPDGWVQAPVSRDEAPAQKTKSAGEADKPKATSAPASGQPMKPGDDPGTAMSEPARGPGNLPSSHN